MLDILREEALSVQADRVGDYIRGVGLDVGVEMVKDAANKEPDGAFAAGIVNGLRDRHVLISATGFHANILKIRPPLVFTTDDADRLLLHAEALLEELAG
ncbi:hypothetical protein [Gluconacetobacter sp.]|uniref:hypothetical protein n=1 Tax=Gluconacetobacter sp. TaxID=1935994 RepID=UPI0039E779D4